MPAVCQKEKWFVVVNAAYAVSDEAEHAESSKNYLLALHWSAWAKHDFDDWHVGQYLNEREGRSECQLEGVKIVNVVGCVRYSDLSSVSHIIIS